MTIAPKPSFVLSRRHLLGIEGLSRRDISGLLDLVRRIRRAQPPGRKEARLAARPHPDQSVLRGLDPHPGLVRTCRQAARRRRHEHVDQFVLDAQGRDADRYGDHAQCHASRHHRRAPSRLRRGRIAGPQGRLLGDQCRRRLARASDPGPARCAHHPPQQGPHRGPPVAICGDILHSRVARSNIILLNAMGARVRVVAPSTLLPPGIERLGVEVARDMREGLADADIVMMLRLQRERMNGSFVPSMSGVFPLLRARREEARLCQAGRAGDASRAR